MGVIRIRRNKQRKQHDQAVAAKYEREGRREVAEEERRRHRQETDRSE
jgi:hypothetical protein